MKKTIYLLLLFLSCSSNDDSSEPSIDVTLLHGQWFHIDLCSSQNNLVLENNANYTHTYSGNTCTINDNDTYQYTGTYIVSGNDITFNQQTEEIIEEGDIINVPVNDDSILLHTKIIELTNTNLTIEFKRRDNFTEEIILTYWNLEK